MLNLWHPDNFGQQWERSSKNKIMMLMNYGMRFVTLYRRQGSRPSLWKRNAEKQNGCLGSISRISLSWFTSIRVQLRLTQWGFWLSMQVCLWAQVLHLRMVVKGLTIARGKREQGCVSTVHSSGLLDVSACFWMKECQSPWSLTGVDIASRARPAADPAPRESLGKKLLERSPFVCRSSEFRVDRKSVV